MAARRGRPAVLPGSDRSSSPRWSRTRPSRASSPGLKAGRTQRPRSDEPPNPGRRPPASRLAATTPVRIDVKSPRTGFRNGPVAIPAASRRRVPYHGLDQGDGEGRNVRRAQHRDECRSGGCQAATGEPRLQLVPGPRQPALDRPHRAAEPARDRVEMKPFHIIKDQGDPIPLGESTDLLVEHRPQLGLLHVVGLSPGTPPARRSTSRRRAAFAFSFVATRRATP